jgi:hypothetical protein
VKNGASNGTGGGGRDSAGAAAGDEAARTAYYDQLDRTATALRTLLDTFGETLRRSRGVEAIDRRPTDREIALQLRLTSSTFLDIAQVLDEEPVRVRPSDEITTATKRVRRRADDDSAAGRKRS